MAGLPVSREYSNAPKACQAHGLAMVSTVERTAPGASFRRVAPRSVSSNVSSSRWARMPKLASVRMKRCSARGCAPTASAMSAADFGRSARWSARPIFAAVYTRLESQKAVPIWIIAMCGGTAGVESFISMLTVSGGESGTTARDLLAGISGGERAS